MRQRHRQPPPRVRARHGLRGFRGLALHRQLAWSRAALVAGESIAPPRTDSSPPPRTDYRWQVGRVGAAIGVTVASTRATQPQPAARSTAWQSPRERRLAPAAAARRRGPAAAQWWSVTKWGSLLFLAVAMLFAILGGLASSAPFDV